VSTVYCSRRKAISNNKPNCLADCRPASHLPPPLQTMPNRTARRPQSFLLLLPSSICRLVVVYFLFEFYGVPYNTLCFNRERRLTGVRRVEKLQCGTMVGSTADKFEGPARIQVQYKFDRVLGLSLLRMAGWCPPRTRKLMIWMVVPARHQRTRHSSRVNKLHQI